MASTKQTKDKVFTEEEVGKVTIVVCVWRTGAALTFTIIPLYFIQHTTESDCWLIIGGEVYDVSKYLDDRKCAHGWNRFNTNTVNLINYNITMSDV